MTDTPQQLQSKSYRILEMISMRGSMRFRDIQRELWKMSHPNKPFTRSLRGYWCTNLLGGEHYHTGLLRFFCQKGVDGQWYYAKSFLPKNPWRYVKAEDRV